jgi:oligogalacturonide lyase
MPVDERWTAIQSRRAFLALAASANCVAQTATGARGEVLSSDAKRYLDPTTEFPLFRMTEPTYNSYLTAPYNRGMSGRNFLLFSSDRQGKLDAYRLDLRNGQWRRLTEAEHLDPASLALLPDDRGFCYVDGASVRLSDFSRMREREVYSVADSYDRLASVALAPDGSHVYVVERKGTQNRVRLVSLSRGNVTDILESEDEVGALLPRPGGGILYQREGVAWFSDRRDSQRTFRLAPGRNGPFYWSPDGASLLYLNVPDRPRELNNIREFVLAKGEDRLIGKTTQFIQFAPNANASVFAGASGSKASPHVLILFRSTRRELTLCEHRAKDVANLAVAFSPNSQRIVFQTDQHGKPAIYAMPVERFVAETES